MYDFAYIECDIHPGVTLPFYRANRIDMTANEITQLHAEIAETLDRMSRVMEVWIETRAGGRDTDTPEREWKELEQKHRRLTRKLTRRMKAQAKRNP